MITENGTILRPVEGEKILKKVTVSEEEYSEVLEDNEVKEDNRLEFLISSAHKENTQGVGLALFNLGCSTEFTLDRQNIPETTSSPDDLTHMLC